MLLSPNEISRAAPPCLQHFYFFIYFPSFFFFSFPLNTAFGWSNQMVSDGLRLYFFFFSKCIIYLWCFRCIFQQGEILPEGRALHNSLCGVPCCQANTMSRQAQEQTLATYFPLRILLLWDMSIRGGFFFFLLLFSIRRVIRDLQSCSITQHALRNSPSARTLLRCLLQSPSSWSPVIIQQFKNFFSSFLKNKTKQNKVSLPRD